MSLNYKNKILIAIALIASFLIISCKEDTPKPETRANYSMITLSGQSFYGENNASINKYGDWTITTPKAVLDIENNKYIDLRIYFNKKPVKNRVYNVVYYPNFYDNIYLTDSTAAIEMYDYRSPDGSIWVSFYENPMYVEINNGLVSLTFTAIPLNDLFRTYRQDSLLISGRITAK